MFRRRDEPARFGQRLMKDTIFNLTLFKAGWVAVVFFAAANLPLAGALAALGVVALHLWRSPVRRAELMLIVVSALVGFTWESFLVLADVLEYGTASVLPGTAPVWIVAMWMLFATTLNVGMRWLRKSRIVAVLAGLVGGPLSFLAGQSAGAVTLTDPVYSVVIIGLGWALLLPALVNVASRYDGFQPAAA